MDRRTRLTWAVEADVDPGVIDRLLAGKTIRAASRKVLEAAAKRLGIAIPG